MEFVEQGGKPAAMANCLAKPGERLEVWLGLGRRAVALLPIPAVWACLGATRWHCGRGGSGTQRQKPVECTACPCTCILPARLIHLARILLHASCTGPPLCLVPQATRRSAYATARNRTSLSPQQHKSTLNIRPAPPGGRALSV